MKNEALKLADELDKYLKGEEYDRLVWEAPTMLRQQADRIAELEKQTKPLNHEEIYDLWCDADNTEWLPEMRMKDGSINYVLTTFVKLLEERHGIK